MVIFDGTIIACVIINSSVSLYGPAIVNPWHPLEIRVASGANLEFGGFHNNLYNVLITGECEHVEIKLHPSHVTLTVSLQGYINLNPIAIETFVNTIVFSLVNNVSLNIPTVSPGTPIYLDVSDLNNYARVTSHGTTLLIYYNVGYLIGLLETSNELAIFLSNAPNSMSWLLMRTFSPGTTYRVMANRVIVPFVNEHRVETNMNMIKHHTNRKRYVKVG